MRRTRITKPLWFQSYPVHELSSFVFFIFPMGILVILYIRMGLRIRQTSEIQRNLPRTQQQQQQNSVPAVVASQTGPGPVPPSSPPNGHASAATATAAAGNSGSFTGPDRQQAVANNRRPVLRMLGE